MIIPRTYTSNHAVAKLALSCLLLLCSVTAFGQSGRRASKSPAVPVPTPEQQQLEKKPASDLTKIPLTVGTNSNEVFAGIPLFIYDSVLQSCARRLSDSSAVQVDPVAKGLSRGDAIEKAKTSSEGYVIWLNLRGDELFASYGNNLDGIYIEYMVFEHTTAKVKVQGNSYQGAYRKGGVVTGPSPGRSNNTIVENRLRVAAEDAAAKILKALHIASASDIPPHE